MKFGKSVWLPLVPESFSQTLPSPPHHRLSLQVGDFSFDMVNIFNLEGDYIQRLEQSSFGFESPTGLAIQPGLFAPLSSFSPPSSAIAGTTIHLPLLLHDHIGTPIDTHLNSIERRSFAIYAAGLITLPGGAQIEANIPGEVLYTEDALPHQATSLSLQLTSATSYTLTAKYGGIVKQHLLSSPSSLEVLPNATDPASSSCTFEPVITAGQLFNVSRG